MCVQIEDQKRYTKGTKMGTKDTKNYRAG